MNEPIVLLVIAIGLLVLFDILAIYRGTDSTRLDNHPDL